MPTVHQLKVTLLRVEPPVWRRIVVPHWYTLGDLGVVLEITMGWSSTLAHLFTVRGQEYGERDDSLGLELADEEEVTVGEALPELGSMLLWEYDLIDGWEHHVVVEQIREVDVPPRITVCLGGARQSPPEDCGGPRGYAQALAVLADPALPDPKGYREWFTGFDPAFFDLAELNQDLAEYN